MVTFLDERCDICYQKDVLKTFSQSINDNSFYYSTADVPEQTKIIQNLIIDADGHTNSCCTNICARLVRIMERLL